MADFMTSIGSAVQTYVTWLGTVGSTIVDTPLLLVGFVPPIFGAAIGLFKRLTRV